MPRAANIRRQSCRNEYRPSRKTEAAGARLVPGTDFLLATEEKGSSRGQRGCGRSSPVRHMLRRFFLRKVGKGRTSGWRKSRNHFGLGQAPTSAVSPTFGAGKDLQTEH